jgi:hypothetical protein
MGKEKSEMRSCTSTIWFLDVRSRLFYIVLLGVRSRSTSYEEIVVHSSICMNSQSLF